MEEDCGRRPGKSGTSTVTSVSSTKRLGNGVVVDVVVVVLLVVVLVLLGAVDEVVALVATLVAFCSDDAVVDVALATPEPPVSTGESVVVVVVIIVLVVVDEAFCKPNVFQMDGPTELNQGGLGLAVDDVGMATPDELRKKKAQ